MKKFLKVVYHEHLLTLEVNSSVRRLCKQVNGRWDPSGWAIKKEDGWVQAKDTETIRQLNNMWEQSNYSEDVFKENIIQYRDNPVLINTVNELRDKLGEYADKIRILNNDLHKAHTNNKHLEKTAIEYRDVIEESEDKDSLIERMQVEVDVAEKRLSETLINMQELKRKLDTAEDIIMNRQPWWKKHFRF